MSWLIWPVVVPIVAALVAFCVPRGLSRGVKWFAVLVAAVTFALCIVACVNRPPDAGINGVALLGLNNLSSFILLGVGFFSLLMTLYSAGFFKPGDVSESSFYANMLLSLGAACGIALSVNLFVLAVFWGLLGIPLYLLINANRTEGANAAAKKTMLILGGTDSLLLLGIAAFFVSTGGALGAGKFDLAYFNMFHPAAPVALNTVAAWCGAICIIVAALAKAGAMPFHTWVPDASQAAPVPAVALLPASLDKLLGIYLLARVFLTLYQVPAGHGLRVACLLIGAATIVFAVMNAMVQHNLRRLLGFHAVSQVGYMVVGIATGSAIGVVGALFHMLNNAIYKSCLFLTAGAAERRTGETELDKMGGLAKAMPLTFVAALIAAFAISGIPPLNGFASKWMVYKGIIGSAEHFGFLWVIVLVAAMFGSALTLASFVKVLHSVFLGQPKKPAIEGPKPGIRMKLPMLVLALLCVVLGIWAVQLGANLLILPGLSPELNAEFAGAGATVWEPGLATVMIISALIIGLLIYLFGTFAKAREDESYIGGEVGERAKMYDFEGVGFYETIRQMSGLRRLYRQAEARWYDGYDQLRRATLYVTGWLRELHSGVLYSYVTWCVLGLVVILWWLLYSYRIVGRAF